MNVLGLVQLCQSAPPGSYSLEQLAATPPHTAAELTELVRDFLQRSIAPTAGLASGMAFRAARQGDYERLPHVCETLDHSVLTDPLRDSSLQMGRRLWGLSRAWEWAAGVHEQLDDFAQRAPLHHAVAFGALVSETTNSETRAIATYLFSTARGIVLTAIRAIPLDEAAGQRVLSDIQDSIAHIAAQYVARDFNHG